MNHVFDYEGLSAMGYNSGQINQLLILKDYYDEDEILKYLDKDTVVVHEHNKVNYNSDYVFTNAGCCVHLIRDLNKLKIHFLENG